MKCKVHFQIFPVSGRCFPTVAHGSQKRDARKWGGQTNWGKWWNYKSANTIATTHPSDTHTHQRKRTLKQSRNVQSSFETDTYNLTPPPPQKKTANQRADTIVKGKSFFRQIYFFSNRETWLYFVIEYKETNRRMILPVSSSAQVVVGSRKTKREAINQQSPSVTTRLKPSPSISLFEQKNHFLLFLGNPTPNSVNCSRRNSVKLKGSATLSGGMSGGIHFQLSSAVSPFETDDFFYCFSVILRQTRLTAVVEIQ